MFEHDIIRITSKNETKSLDSKPQSLMMDMAKIARKQIMRQEDSEMFKACKLFDITYE